jgi:hypothetical protein
MCSSTLLSMLNIAEHKGDAAGAALKRTLLQPVLLELLPHMQDRCNVWAAADTPTASSSSSGGGLPETGAAAGFAEGQADDSDLQANLSQLLVSLVFEGEVDTSHWHFASDAHIARLQ